VTTVEGRSEWVGRVELQVPALEGQVREMTGGNVLIACDEMKWTIRMIVDPLHPAMTTSVADVMAGLWPGFLAPLGVSFEICGDETWDAEAMALRYAARH